MGISNGEEKCRDSDNGTDLSSTYMNFMQRNYGETAQSQT